MQGELHIDYAQVSKGLTPSRVSHWLAQSSYHWPQILLYPILPFSSDIGHANEWINWGSQIYCTA